MLLATDQIYITIDAGAVDEFIATLTSTELVYSQN